jgi:anti-sigma B factor antagonist
VLAAAYGSAVGGGEGHGSDIDNPEAVMIRRIGNAVVAAVSGEIDMVTAPLLHPAIAQHAAVAECSLLVVDLGEVSFLDSHGLTALVNIRQFAEDRGLSLSIVAAENRHVMRALEITDLDKVLPICASVDEALSAG